MLRDRRALDVLAADKIIFFVLIFSRATAEEGTGVTTFAVSREVEADALRFEGVRGDFLSGLIASSRAVCGKRLVGVVAVDAAADDAVPIVSLPLLRGVVDMVNNFMIFRFGGPGRDKRELAGSLKAYFSRWPSLVACAKRGLIPQRNYILFALRVWSLFRAGPLSREASRKSAVPSRPLGLSLHYQSRLNT
jgi:hypothetical protein